MRVSFEYASANTPQQIEMSEHVSKALVAMVRCLPTTEFHCFSGKI